MKDIIIKLEVFWIRQSKFKKFIYIFLLWLILLSIFISITYLPITRIVVTPEELALFSQKSVKAWALMDGNEINDLISMDKNGNLVFTFVKSNFKINTNKLIDVFEALEQEEGIIYNEDYTQVIADSTKTPDLTKSNSPWGIFECVVYQLYNGVSPTDIAVDFKIVAPDTGEVVYQVSYPQEIVEFTYNTENGQITLIVEKDMLSVNEE